ncbi:MAG TPA: ABC transporter permease [Acidimicrobiia bacterium]
MNRIASSVVSQVRHQNRVFWRNPLAAGFTVALPLMFLVLFNLIFGEGSEEPDFSQFFTPSIAVFAAVSATFTNLAIGTGLAREQGILKRVRGTPLPPLVYMAGRVGSGVWIATISAVIMIAVGAVFYDFHIVWENLPIAVLTFAAGIACFAALGLALVALVRRGDAVPAVANAFILPLAFVSGIFVATENLPPWLADAASLFPLRHFAELFGRSFDPDLVGPVLGWGHLGALLLWTAVAGAVALRWFSWDPSES